MIAKHTTINLSHLEFHEIFDFIRLSPCKYIISGEEQVEQKLKSIHQSSKKKLQLMELIDSSIKLYPPIILSQGYNILSKFASLDQESVVALISQGGNRSIIKVNSTTNAIETLIPNIPYKEHHAQAVISSYKLFMIENVLVLTETHQYDNKQFGKYVYVEITRFTEQPSSILSNKINTKDNGYKITIKQIYNTQLFAIKNREKLYYADNNQFTKSTFQLLSQFKLKFMFAIQNNILCVLIKDRIDKFYKYMLQQGDFEYFETLKPFELLNNKVTLADKRKSSINLIMHKTEKGHQIQYYFIVSTIYQLDEQNLFCNIFKLDNDYKLTFVDGFHLAKSAEIQFIQKDQRLDSDLLFKVNQSLKQLDLCLN